MSYDDITPNIDWVALEDVPIRHKSKYEIVIGNFCHCRFITSEKSNMILKKMHPTNVSSDGICTNCGHYAVTNVVDRDVVTEDTILTERGSIVKPIPEKIKKDCGLMTLVEMERQHIKNMIIYANNNQTQAASILGTTIRTLRNRVTKYAEDGDEFFIKLRKSNKK